LNSTLAFVNDRQTDAHEHNLEILRLQRELNAATRALQLAGEAAHAQAQEVAELNSRLENDAFDAVIRPDYATQPIERCDKEVETEPFIHDLESRLVDLTRSLQYSEDTNRSVNRDFSMLQRDLLETSGQLIASKEENQELKKEISILKGQLTIGLRQHKLARESEIASLKQRLSQKEGLVDFLIEQAKRTQIVLPGILDEDTMEQSPSVSLIASTIRRRAAEWAILDRENVRLKAKIQEGDALADGLRTLYVETAQQAENAVQQTRQTNEELAQLREEMEVLREFEEWYACMWVVDGQTCYESFRTVQVRTQLCSSALLLTLFTSGTCTTRSCPCR